MKKPRKEREPTEKKELTEKGRAVLVAGCLVVCVLAVLYLGLWGLYAAATAPTQWDFIDCAVMVAADNVISDNNPALPMETGGYEVQWTVSNSENFEIVDGRLAVKSYAGMTDETLTLTAAVCIPGTQELMQQEHFIEVTVLRPGGTFPHTLKAQGLDSVCRESEFSLDISYEAQTVEGFSQPVRPVVEEIRESLVCALPDGSQTARTAIVEEREPGEYRVLADAPLKARMDLTLEAGHYEGGRFLVDDSVTRQLTVAPREYRLTYEADGGTVKVSGRSVAFQSMPEEGELFRSVNVYREDHLFEGWFLDAECTLPLWNTGEEAVYMPSEDLTVYAKWKPNTQTVTFDPGGGQLEELSREVFVGKPYGQLPLPTLDHHDFTGWFTEDGTQVNADTVMNSDKPLTLTARWEEKPVSDWVEENQVPEGARIVEEKWVYTLTEERVSTESSISGWKQTGSFWDYVRSGSVTCVKDWPEGFSREHDLYSQYGGSFVRDSETGTEKTTNDGSRITGYLYYHWCRGTNDRVYNRASKSMPEGEYRKFHAFYSDLDPDSLPQSPDQDGSCKNVNRECCGDSWWFFHVPVYTQDHTVYQKMYSHQKVTTGLESKTQVRPGDGISDVVRYVKYQEK